MASRSSDILFLALLLVDGGVDAELGVDVPVDGVPKSSGSVEMLRSETKEAGVDRGIDACVSSRWS
jgi:hypothetical protein